MSKQKIRALVVGCGSIGLRHLNCLCGRNDVEIAATDMAPGAHKAVAKIDNRIDFFESFEDSLAWKPEITIVCTPNSAHAPVAVEAIKAGSHILCEKPIADTVGDGKKMVAAARKHKKILAVGYSERFRPAVEHLQDMAKKKRFGNLIGGRAMVGTYNTLLCAKSNFRDKVFGILVVDYTHEIDILRSIFGEVKSIAAKSNRIARREKLNTNPSLVAMLLEYGSGAIVSVHMDYVQHPQRRIMEIIGDKRTAEFDLQTDQVKLFDCNRPGYEVLQFESIRNERFAAEHQDMIDAIRKKRIPRVDGQGAVKVLEVAEKVIRKIRKP